MLSTGMSFDTVDVIVMSGGTEMHVAIMILKNLYEFDHSLPFISWVALQVPALEENFKIRIFSIILDCF